MPSSKASSSRRSRSSSRARSKSPARTKPASKSRSSRSKSPARTQRQSRSKSPARGKAPKSPSRSTKSKSPSRSKASKSPASPKGASQRTTRSRSPARKSEPVKEVKPAPRATSTPKPAAAPATPPRQRTVTTTTTVVQGTRSSRRIAEKNGENETVREPASPKAEKSATRKYEFGGPIGTSLLVVLMPLIVFLINYGCNPDSCTLQSFLKLSMPKLKWSNYFNYKAASVYVGWFVFQAVLALVPWVGKDVTGKSTPAGRLTYRCNGLFALAVSLAVFALAVYNKYDISFLHTQSLQLACTSIVFSFVLSTLLYVKASWAKKSRLVEKNNTGCSAYDFFMGRELNPRVYDFDLKFFCELRPGLIGWLMINLSMCVAAYKTGAPFPIALGLVTAFQALYVADALWFEECLLSTMDIVHDGFGFMLVFGDLSWVPFLYGLQAHYIFSHGTTLSTLGLGLTSLLFCAGYFIFRHSNLQKARFRAAPHDPAMSHFDTIPTPSGRRLLVSGWWGLIRHPNYLGDLVMALSWSLLCGCGSIVPYFYPIYFLVLLVHRSRRDNAHCAVKHGAAWGRYCGKVKYTLVPFIY